VASEGHHPDESQPLSTFLLTALVFQPADRTVELV
jgi:hypothetical protein